MSPGPAVTAIPSIASRPVEASDSAFPTTGTIDFRCSREASSGTTPPYAPWTATWEETTLESNPAETS